MEKLDLTKVLEKCPKGTPLYSPLFGEVKLDTIELDMQYPISVLDCYKHIKTFTKNGKWTDINFDKMLVNTKPEVGTQTNLFDML